jgi:hypothetical protein
VKDEKQTEQKQVKKEETISLSEALGNLQLQKIALMEQQTQLLERIAIAIENLQAERTSQSSDSEEETEESEEEIE